MKIPNLKYFFLIVILYIFLFNPVFQIFDFGLIKVLLLASIAYIAFTGKIRLFLNLFKNEIILSLILITYTLLVVFWGDGTAFKVPYTHLVWFMECFFIPFFLILFFKNIFQKRTWESLVVQTGLIAALITLFLVLNPDINFFIRDSVIRDLQINLSSTKTLSRGFTIAENSTFSYGVVQGLILSICIISLKKNYLYAIPIVFLFIAILYNARIGFACLFIGVALVVFRRKIKIRSAIIFGLVLLAGYFFLFNSGFSKNNHDSLLRGLSFFSDTMKFITGDQSHASNYSVLFNKMVFFPSHFINLVFGEGKIVFYASKGSDIGYINQIFTGGIVYLFLLLAFLFYMFLRNFDQTSNKLLPVLFVLSLLVVNIKGNALFVSNGFFRLFCFFYVYSTLVKKTDYLILNSSN